MPKEINRLNPQQVRSKGEGRWPDGNGLYLVVRGGSRIWLLVFSFQNCRREMSLGSAFEVRLSDARELAGTFKKMAREGIDPIAARRHPGRQIAEPPRAKAKSGMTFGEFADQRIAAMEPEWKKPADGTESKTKQGWVNSLKRRSAPLCEMPLAAIDVPDIVAVLEPEWHSKPEISKSTQERLELVLSAAIAMGLRKGPNPASWKGNLEHVLRRKRGRKRGPHASIPHEEAPAFYAALSTRFGMGALALLLTILTGTRTAQTMLAKWSEFDLRDGVWRVPLERVKNDEAFRERDMECFMIPLSASALEILRRSANYQFGGRPVDGSKWVFPGYKEGKSISNNTMRALLQRMGIDATVHGFRSTLRSWVSEQVRQDGSTRFDFEVAEFCIGHIIGNKASQAYRRGQMMAPRRIIMDEWATYVTGRAQTLAVVVA